MNDDTIRDHVIDLLTGGNAHVRFHDVIAGFPEELRGAKIRGVSHTPWRLLEHMRIAQWDILEFSRNPVHVSPDFPEGYWPEGDAPPHAEAWDQSVAAFERQLQEMIDLVSDPATDLYAKIAHGDGQTVLREALLLADHNAYHLGQLAMLRTALAAGNG